MMHALLIAASLSAQPLASEPDIRLNAWLGDELVLQSMMPGGTMALQDSVIMAADCAHIFRAFMGEEESSKFALVFDRTDQTGSVYFISSIYLHFLSGRPVDELHLRPANMYLCGRHRGDLGIALVAGAQGELEWLYPPAGD